MTDPRLLPDGIEEILPDDARVIEALRRRILDLFVTWGYERVTPPLIDFLSTLQIGSGQVNQCSFFPVLPAVERPH